MTARHQEVPIQTIAVNPIRRQKTVRYVFAQLFAMSPVQHMWSGVAAVLPGTERLATIPPLSARRARGLKLSAAPDRLAQAKAGTACWG